MTVSRAIEAGAARRWPPPGVRGSFGRCSEHASIGVRGQLSPAAFLHGELPKELDRVVLRVVAGLFTLLAEIVRVRATGRPGTTARCWPPADLSL